MRDILFDGKHDVSITEVLERMNYYLNVAEKGMKTYKNNSKESLEIAKKLRAELEKEYKYNSLKRIKDIYDNNHLFHYYEPAIHEAIASITGRLSYKNLFGFLYDVSYYMRYYMPSLDK